MCNPLAIIGGVIQGIGAARQARAARNAANQQAALSEMQAQNERIVANSKINAVMRNAYRIGGQQRAAATEGGLEMTGSVVDVMTDTANEVDLDVQTILWNSQAYVDTKKYEANIHRSNARSASASVPFAFLSPILNTAARLPSFGTS